MDLVSWFFVFIFFHLWCFDSAQGQTTSHSNCTEQFECGFLGDLSFPFYKSTEPDCGLFKVDCDDHLIELGGMKYQVLEKDGAFMKLKDPILGDLLKKNSCQTFDKKFDIPFSRSIICRVDRYLTLFKCNRSHNTYEEVFDSKIYQSYNVCGSFIIYYNTSIGEYPAFDLPTSCSVIQLPVQQRRHVSY